MKYFSLIFLGVTLCCASAFAMCPPGKTAKTVVTKHCTTSDVNTKVTRRICETVYVSRPRYVTRCHRVVVRRVYVRRVCRGWGWRRWRRGPCRIIRSVRYVPRRVCRTVRVYRSVPRRSCRYVTSYKVVPKKTCTTVRKTICE